MFVTKGKSYLFRLLFPKINQFRTCAAFDLITQQRSITSFFFKRHRHTLSLAQITLEQQFLLNIILFLLSSMGEQKVQKAQYLFVI